MPRYSANDLLLELIPGRKYTSTCNFTSDIYCLGRRLALQVFILTQNFIDYK